MNHNLSDYWMGRLLAMWLSGLAVTMPLLAGCATERDLGLSSARGGSCVGCHTSKDQLIATAEPDTGTVEDPGEG
jgi:hypothetical protein